MEYISKDYLRKISRVRHDKARFEKTASRVLLTEGNALPAHNYIFISHSYLDKDIIVDIADMFENANYKTYVDWRDEALPEREYVSVSTAETLRKNIIYSKALIYVASEGSSESIWMPWELGFSDGNRDNKTAILPLVEHEGNNFNIGREYLALYPTVRISGTDLIIRYLNGKETSFDYWSGGSSRNNVWD